MDVTTRVIGIAADTGPSNEGGSTPLVGKMLVVMNVDDGRDMEN